MNHLARRSIVTLLACALIAGVAFARNHHPKRNDSGGHFDYYLMSLSWSPSYCVTHPRDVTQCGPHGFGFVLHGLWPQFRNGSWPQRCRTTRAAPDEATITHALAFMPSRHLIEHEWQTHGTCTGMDSSAYFAQADRAFASVKIPAELQAPLTPPKFSANDLVNAFIQTNPGLRKNMISVACHDGNQLTEVHVCLNKDTLLPQACTGRVRNSCRYGELRIPAVR